MLDLLCNHTKFQTDWVTCLVFIQFLKINFFQNFQKPNFGPLSNALDPLLPPELHTFKGCHKFLNMVDIRNFHEY